MLSHATASMPAATLPPSTVAISRNRATDPLSPAKAVCWRVTVALTPPMAAFTRDSALAMA